MTRKRNDLTGQRFGHLFVLEYAPEKIDRNRRKRFYKCRCDCGSVVFVRADNLKSGHSTQCLPCAKYKIRKKVDESVVRES